MNTENAPQMVLYEYWKCTTDGTL